MTSERSNSRLVIQETLENDKEEVPMDWRPQLLRLSAIFIVVVGHMFFFTGVLRNDPATEPLVWLGGFALTTFMACSGYVHGLKDEFNKPGSLNRSTYGRFFKKRFLRLYIGYYIAIIAVLIAKIFAGFTVSFSTGDFVIGETTPWAPIHITPTSLILDLTCMWPLFTLGQGGIWPEGWFVCAIMMLSLSYPIIRKLYSMNHYYVYLIIIVALIVRLYTIIFINASYAYFFPFAWLAEFSIGIIVGDRICRKGGPKPPDSSWKVRICAAADRVWPLYLYHMIVVVFMTPPLINGVVEAPIWEFFVFGALIILVVEFFYRSLNIINKKMGMKKKPILPPGD